MMKKTFIFLCLCGLTALTGCQNDSAQNDLYQESGNTINVNDQRAELYHQGNDGDRDDVSEDFGYVRHQRSPVLGESVANEHYAAIDREQLADIISKYSTEVPNVDDVSTLVTDEEVIIIYDADTEDRNYTADQVKRMALSVVPSWYHIYVSDNTNLRKTVESYATMDSNSENADYGISQLIKELQKSPQGVKKKGDPDQGTMDENNL
ncbi:YhcN/YlaJ family sporulation lipoprotein [Cytobacillus gottheilii]